MYYRGTEMPRLLFLFSMCRLVSAPPPEDTKKAGPRLPDPPFPSEHSARVPGRLTLLYKHKKRADI